VGGVGASHPDTETVYAQADLGVHRWGGARAAGHMNGVRDLVRDIFIEAGIPQSSIIYEPYLPGYYRARKKWDMAVRYKGS
jgi:hypothetical protein